MSTDLHKNGQAGAGDPHHETVSFETSDVETKSILVYLLYLAIAVGVSFFACVYILRFTEHFAGESYAPPPPSRAALGNSYSDGRQLEPALQGIPGHEADPQLDDRNKIAIDNEENEKTGWIDETTGIAQIPVKDAMKMIVEKGLPVVPVAPPAKK